MSVGNVMGFGIPGAPKMIDSFLHPEDAYKDAEEQQQKYYTDAQGKLQPYNQNGQDQYAQLNQQGQALNNPAQLESQWASGYEASPYAQQMMNQAKSSGMDAASSMGLLGSSAAVNNIQNSASNIMQGDRQNYMNDLMQKYMASIGIGQNLYGTGAAAASGQSQNAMNQGQQMAKLKYGESAAPGQMLGNILGGAANGAINYATGGLAGVAKGMNANKMAA